jgi:cytidylate kinase
MNAIPSAGSTAKPVVTLFELYGAGADYVGHHVAERLGLPFHAQAFSSEAIAGDPGAQNEEAATLAQVFSVLGGAYGGFDGRDVATTQRQKYDLVMDNNKVVWQYADEGGVIIGRNGAVILAERPNTVHVLLTGTVEDRVARAAEAAGITQQEAAKRQEREDQVRSDMSKVLYGWDPRMPERYDLVLNTSRIPLDSVVNAIVDAVGLAVS